MVVSCADGHDVRHADRRIIRDEETPANHCAIGLQCHVVITASRNGHHVRQPRRHVGLAKSVFAPGNHGAIGFERQTMIISCRNGHHVRQSRRRIHGHDIIGSARRIIIGSPSGDRAVNLKRHAVSRRTGNGHHVAQAGGDVCLAVVVDTPSEHGAIGFQRQTMIPTGGNHERLIQAGWHRGLAGIGAVPIGVVTPSRHRAIGLQHQTVTEPCGNLDHIGQTCRHGCLANIVVAPSCHGSIGPERQTVIGTSASSNRDDVGQSGRKVGLSERIITPDNHPAGRVRKGHEKRAASISREPIHADGQWAAACSCGDDNGQ